VFKELSMSVPGEIKSHTGPEHLSSRNLTTR
jgi:hypothetical protein